jgi:hypothetical protein
MHAYRGPNYGGWTLDITDIGIVSDPIGDLNDDVDSDPHDITKNGDDVEQEDVSTRSLLWTQ